MHCWQLVAGACRGTQMGQHCEMDAGGTLSNVLGAERACGALPSAGVDLAGWARSSVSGGEGLRKLLDELAEISYVHPRGPSVAA